MPFLTLAEGGRGVCPRSCRSHTTIALASQQSQDEACPASAGLGSHPITERGSAVMYPASFMEGELHPTDILLFPAHWISCMVMRCLIFLVSSSPEADMGYTLPCGFLTIRTLRSMIVPFARS